MTADDFTLVQQVMHAPYSSAETLADALRIFMVTAVAVYLAWRL